MKKTSHDIYGTMHNDPNRNALYDGPRPTGPLPGQDLLTQHRRQTFLFGAVAFLCALLFVLVVVQQYRLTSSPRFEPPTETRDRLVSRSGSLSTFLDFTMDRHTTFLMDELREPGSVVDNPNARDMPLEGPWIKKVAYHLIQAELHEREGLRETARDHYESALRIFPDLRGVHQRLGLLYMQREEYANAVAAFEQAALEDTLSYAIANNLGAAYMNMDETVKAEQHLLQAIRLNPEYPPAYFNLGQLYMRGKDYRQAAAYFQQYMQMEPTRVEAALTFAYILIQLEEWEAVVELLGQISRIAPESPSVHFRLAQALSHTGEHHEAIRSLNRGISLVDARNALVWMSRNEFDPLRDHPDFQQWLNELGGTL